MMTPESIISSARELIGTPFRHQGRTAGRGVDCAGVLVHIARDNGVEPADQAAYGRLPMDGQIERALEDNVRLNVIYRVQISEMQAADLVLMRFEGENSARHLGLCAGTTLIHAWAVARKVCEHDFDATWRRRVVRVYRFTGLSHGG